MDFAAVQLLILDVDGVLTDGRLFPSPGGGASAIPELDAKVFHVQDGCAIRLWLARGGKAAFLSGRKSAWTTARAKELGVALCRVGMADKLAAYDQIRKECGCEDGQVAYVGDDLPDLRPMARCGFPVAVADAVPAVKRAACYVTRRPGGEGAVAEIVEYLLRRRRCWSSRMLGELSTPWLAQTPLLALL